MAAFGYAGRSFAVLRFSTPGSASPACAESPLLQAVLSDLTGNGMARAASGFLVISHAVGALGVAVTGWVISATLFPVPFAVMAASFAVAAVINGAARCPL